MYMYVFTYVGMRIYVYVFVCVHVCVYEQASLHRLNWMANPDTENGLLHSAGLMVNYLYAIPAVTTAVAAITSASTTSTTATTALSAQLPMSLQKLKNDENIQFLQHVNLSSRADLIQEKNIHEVPVGSQIQDILKP